MQRQYIRTQAVLPRYCTFCHAAVAVAPATDLCLSCGAYVPKPEPAWKAILGIVGLAIAMYAMVFLMHAHAAPLREVLR